jgi:hypothetical protein
MNAGILVAAELLVRAGQPEDAVRLGASESRLEGQGESLPADPNRSVEMCQSSVGGGYGVRVLDAYETDPDVWRTRLLQVLTASGVDTDEESLAAARAVLRAERRTGRISMDADGVTGVLLETETGAGRATPS